MKYTVDFQGIVTVEREIPPEADGIVMPGTEKYQSCSTNNYGKEQSWLRADGTAMDGRT